MKPYFSVDVETTGLDRKNDMLLELAAIYEDPSIKFSFENIPKFNCFIKHPEYRGSSAYAFALNKSIFDELICFERNKATTAPVYSLEVAIKEFCNFVSKYTTNPVDQVRFTGKNYASFDHQFLQRDGMDAYIKYNHRFLDIGSLMFDAETMDWIPSSEECYGLAGIDKSVSHKALYDAWDAIQIIRTKY
ncbi:MAG: hypothetical protein HC836_15785 [Richelia sp. RM2_1_2]|nr:hypothetical protein [Richelia sp. RM2_1_2]